MKSNRLSLFAIASIPLVMTLGNSMLIPILPQIADALHIRSFQSSMLITVYSAAAIVLIPAAGYLSDRYGRKKIIMPALIVTAAGGAVCAASAILLQGAAAYWVILAGRLIQGIGASGAFPIVLPLVGDLLKNEEEISQGMGMIETANTFGKVLSPIIGAALGLWLWYAPFMAIPVLCVLSILMIGFLVKTPQEKGQEQSLKQFWSSIRQIFKEQGRWLYAVFFVGASIMFLLFGVLFYLSSLLEEKHDVDGIMKGLVLAIPLSALCLASYLTGKFSGNKRTMKWISLIGMMVMGASLFLVGIWEQIFVMMALFTIGGAGIGAALPCLDALITDGIEKQQRGTVTSIYSSMRFIGVALGPPGISLMNQSSHGIQFISLGSLSAVSGLVILLFIKPKKMD